MYKTKETLETWEDWNEVNRNGEYQVLDEKVIIQLFNNTARITLASSVSERNAEGLQYTLCIEDDYNAWVSSSILNYLSDKYNNYKLSNLLIDLAMCDSGVLGGMSVTKSVVSIKNLRPAWYEAPKTTKNIKLKFGAVLVDINTNRSIDFLVDGKKIQSFKIGDEVEQGSYNLIYTGNIIEIKEKYVKISGCPVGITNTPYSTFVGRNHSLDLVKIGEHNANWTD